MIVNRLTTLRKAKRWSLQYTADRLGIAKSTYAGYESGHRRPSLETVNLLAGLYDTSTDYILGRVDYPSKDITTESPRAMELTDSPNMKLAVDGISLSEEETIQFIAFIRAKREVEIIRHKQKET
ncbi:MULTISPECIES: helix-turn-helix domain-containing protein [Peribacillus]|uniref:helix-turn-helix domain-containing protein n=1 Tax=Peribacillus TaxID=2675229 RepID=UPI0021A327DD|nr:helix-turn-helix transcriptional regulator [Peribacillus sp. BBB004]